MDATGLHTLLKEYVEPYALAFFGVDGPKAAAYAEVNGGFIPFRVESKSPWKRAQNGRVMPFNVIVLDISVPMHEQIPCFLHEVGHIDYYDRTPKADRKDEAAEFHAQQFAVEQMLARNLDDSLKFFALEVENTQHRSRKLIDIFSSRSYGARSKTDFRSNQRQELGQFFLNPKIRAVKNSNQPNKRPWKT